MVDISWDLYFSTLASVVSLKSKDPSSRIGAVLVGPEKEVISTGFNGFPRGIDEKEESRWDRPIKYSYVEHAERNAIYNAARVGVSTKGSTLYLYGFGPPTVPCTECAKAVIQAGIVRVVGFPYKAAYETWKNDLNFSVSLLTEAGVDLVEWSKPLLTKT